jgi:hypothetical protein
MFKVKKIRTETERNVKGFGSTGINDNVKRLTVGLLAYWPIGLSRARRRARATRLIQVKASEKKGTDEKGEYFEIKADDLTEVTEKIWKEFFTTQKILTGIKKKSQTKKTLMLNLTIYTPYYIERISSIKQ